MEQNNKIIDKLAKMLRHQESARAIGSAAEAEAFAVRIQELLNTHKLEMSDIQFVEQERTEPIDEEIVRPDDVGARPENKRVKWQENLAYAIARSNDCRTLISNHSNYAFFVGRQSDREICVALFRYFLTLILDMAEKAAGEARESERVTLQNNLGNFYSGARLRWRMRDFRESFSNGMSQAIQRRLIERRQEMEKRMEAQAAESTAVIHLRKTSEDIQNYLDDKFKDQKPRRAQDNIKQTGHVREAYQRGLQAGESVALTAGALK